MLNLNRFIDWNLTNFKKDHENFRRVPKYIKKFLK